MLALIIFYCCAAVVNLIVWSEKLIRAGRIENEKE